MAVAVCLAWVLPIRADDLRGDWWMLGHDARHTGRSAYAGPTVATYSWQHSTAADFLLTAPVVAADGTVYVGSEDGKL